jgi:hypothetical protein
LGSTPQIDKWEDRMSSESESLDRRIRKLEAQNRRLKWAGIIAVALVLVAAARGQTAKETVVSAQKFELRDDSGHSRAELSIVNGESTLRFIGADGVAQSSVSGDQFAIYEKEGDSVAYFAKDGLEFGDGHEKTYARITAHQDDRMGKLQLNDYRTRTYVVITAKELAKLRQLDVNGSR